MVTPSIMAGRKADAASPVFTKPGEYGRWIAAVVNHFGEDAVARSIRQVAAGRIVGTLHGTACGGE